MTETIRKAKYLYEKGKGRESMHRSWKDKKKERSDHRRKGFKLPFNRNNPNKIRKKILLRMIPIRRNPWEKEEDHQSNVGGAMKITYTRTVLTKEIK